LFTLIRISVFGNDPGLEKPTLSTMTTRVHEHKEIGWLRWARVEWRRIEKRETVVIGRDDQLCMTSSAQQKPDPESDQARPQLSPAFVCHEVLQI
jgi:hypothetical protein